MSFLQTGMTVVVWSDGRHFWWVVYGEHVMTLGAAWSSARWVCDDARGTILPQCGDCVVTLQTPYCRCMYDERDNARDIILPLYIERGDARDSLFSLYNECLVTLENHHIVAVR